MANTERLILSKIIFIFSPEKFLTEMCKIRYRSLGTQFHFFFRYFLSLSFFIWPLLLTHCRCTGLLFHVITLSDTPHLVGLLWTKGQPVADTLTPKHTTLTRDKHPSTRQDSNTDPSLRAAADRRLRPPDHHDRWYSKTNVVLRVATSCTDLL